MGGFGPVACESFLVGRICVCVLLDRTRSLLSETKCSVQYGVLGVYGFCMALNSPSFNVQGYAPALLED